MRNNDLNRRLPSIFGDAMDSIFNTRLSDIMGSDLNMSTPSVNVVEKEDKYEIQLAAPGMNKKDFNIELDNDRLKISSELENKSSDEDSNYVRREYNYQSFMRSFTLPDTVDTDSINAKYEDGILNITIAKKEQSISKGPKEINID